MAEAAIKRLRAGYDRLQNRVHAAYVDKLDGTIDAAFFDSLGYKRTLSGRASEVRFAPESRHRQRKNG